MSEVVQCPICEEHVVQFEDHHIIPIHLGGPKDGKMIRICQPCHDAVHNTAKAMLSKNPKKKQYFTNLKHLERAAPLIDAIIKATYLNEGVRSDKRRRRMYILEVSDVTHVRLHKVKRDMGYTNLDNWLADLFEAIANGKIKL